MKPGIPWSVKGIEPEVREAAKHAAKRAGMTLGEWLNSVILEQNEQAPSPQEHHEAPAPEEIYARPEAPKPRHEPAPRGDSALRLQDIAAQLSRLAQRERESAAITPYEAPAPREDERIAFDRILNRIDSNERQTVEALTAVNERLSVLGRQIALAAKPAKAIEKPEDVPGYAALEQAIRNVVEHIEVSEKRTRDSLKSMQDRLSDMAERATRPSNPDELLKSAPAFAGLEARIAEIADRMQRSENLLRSGLPDLVKQELDRLTERIESVRASTDAMVHQAQSSAAVAARNELQGTESKILGILKEAQATIGSQQAAVSDLQKLKGEFGVLNRRIDEMRSGAASERDVQALRVAVEQLSTRVAQGPDMRPIADMDRRLGELNRKLDQNSAANRNLPQFTELERRIAELDHRMGEVIRLQGDSQAVKTLERHIAGIHERVEKTETQLGHLETMERAIRQLYESLAENRSQAGQVAEEAAGRAVERYIATQVPAGPSPELRALEDGLRAVRESAAGAEQRNQETLEAVHETLEQIVNKLAELETASAGQLLAASMAEQNAANEPQHSPAAPAPMPQPPERGGASPFFDPASTFDQQIFTAPQSAPSFDAAAQAPRAPEPVHPARPAPPSSDVMSSASTLSDGGDDFIAAARRAAQAAASRPSTSHAVPKPAQEQAAPGEKKKFSFSLPFLKGGKQLPEPITFVNGQPVVGNRPAAAADDSKRKKLVLMGIVLLAAISAFTFNMLAKPKPVKESTAIEAPAISVPQVAGNIAQPPKAALPSHIAEAGDAPSSDPTITGSLPAKKTDATITSIVAAPGAARAEMPPPEVGSLALREAAAIGDAKAQFIIASRYLDGQGIAQDLPKAAYWYQQAAARGLAPAQYRLATLFERGKGVPQDMATAFLWYERAAEGGNVKAMHNAAVIAAGNQAGTPNYDKAFKWFKAAAERGLHDSQFNLAVLYERGLGTRIDTQEAHFWYALAGQEGDKDAMKRAENLAAGMTPQQSASAAARIAAWQPAQQLQDGNVVAIADAAWSEAGAQMQAAPDAAPSFLAPDATVQMMTEAPVAEAPVATAANPVEEAQVLLTRMGFNVGSPDGKMGSRTANAIRLFQLQSGLEVTGEVTPDVLDAMRAKAQSGPA